MAADSVFASNWWCIACSRLVNLPDVGDDVQCPLCHCHDAMEQIRWRRVLVSIPVLVLWPRISASRRGGEEEYDLRERAILVDPRGQPTVVPSTNFDSLLIAHANRILHGDGTSGHSTTSLSTSVSKEFMKKDRMPALKAEESESECAVCLERFGEGEEEEACREMACKHAYHERCILKWLANRSTCPLCRVQLPVPERQLVSVSGGTNERPFREGGDGIRSRTVMRWTAVLPQVPVQELQLVAANDADDTNERSYQERGDGIGRRRMVMRFTVPLPELVSSPNVGTVNQESSS